MDKIFTRVCRLNDLEENRAMVASVEGKQILLTKVDGGVFAVENHCTHEDFPLGEGEIVDGQIQCRHHGGRFDIKTGRATQIPAVVDLKTFEVRIDNNDILVAIR